MIKATVSLAGVAPLILNNSRSSNPLNPEVRNRAALTAKRKKTWDDHIRIAEIGARLACYETEDGTLGLPTANVWRALYDAAKKSSMGETLKEALLFDPGETAEILIEDRPQDVSAFLGAGNVFTVPAKLQGKSTIQVTRPIIPSGWKTTHHFAILEEFLDADLLAGFAFRAQTRGVGDWRPRYGRFTAEVNFS